MRENREILRTYNKIWNAPFKIYSIDKIKLIIPINPWDVLYYLVGVLIATALNWIIYMPSIYQYLVIPILFRFLLTKVKLDGKRPHKFFFGMIVYFITNKEKEYFRSIEKQSLKTFKGEKILFKYKEQ